VWLKFTDISEGRAASIIRVKEYVLLRILLSVCLFSLLLDPEVSSEILVIIYQNIRRHIAADRSVHNHCLVDLKSGIQFVYFSNIFSKKFSALTVAMLTSRCSVAYRAIWWKDNRTADGKIILH
jgi:hypothetical protein